MDEETLLWATGITVALFLVLLLVIVIRGKQTPAAADDDGY